MTLGIHLFAKTEFYNLSESNRRIKSKEQWGKLTLEEQEKWNMKAKLLDRIKKTEENEKRYKNFPELKSEYKKKIKDAKKVYLDLEKEFSDIQEEYKLLKKQIENPEKLTAEELKLLDFCG